MRSLSLEEGTNLQETIDSTCQTLLSRIPLTEGIRLIGVTASNLGAPLSIPSLFSDEEDKRSRAAKVMDRIQEKCLRTRFPPLLAPFSNGKGGKITW